MKMKKHIFKHSKKPIKQLFEGKKSMSKRKMIEKILENQNRANDHIFTEKKLKSINYEMLSIIYEASQHMVTK